MPGQRHRRGTLFQCDLQGRTFLLIVQMPPEIRNECTIRISPTHYDRLMRLPIILFTGFFLVREIGLLGDFLAHYQTQVDIQFIANLGARVSLILFLLLLVGLHAIRARPINKAQGWQPKISALLGLTLGNLLLLVDRSVADPWVDILSASLLLIGNYFCIIALLHLGRSISIMAEARRLVTSGPYAIVRHRCTLPKRSPLSASSCNSVRGKPP